MFYNVINDDAIVKIDGFCEVVMTERTLSFAELARTDFNVGAAAAVSRRWEDGNRNNYLSGGRRENILSYTAEGGKNIYVPGKKDPVVSLSSPGAVFIAEGTPYLSETLSGGRTGQTFCIRFRLTDAAGCRLVVNDSPLAFADDRSGSLGRAFQAAFDCFIRPSSTPAEMKSCCFAVFARLFSSLSADSARLGFENLMPAVRALEDNPAADLSVAELARMCFLSESYFRSRFKQFSGGLSPSEYRNRLRIRKAQELLSSSLWTTELIAEALGFYDTSHFYRIYKKYTGKTPKQAEHAGKELL